MAMPRTSDGDAPTRRGARTSQHVKQSTLPRARPQPTRARVNHDSPSRLRLPITRDARARTNHGGALRARTSTLWGARGQRVLGTSMRPIGAHVAQPPGGSPLHMPLVQAGRRMRCFRSDPGCKRVPIFQHNRTSGARMPPHVRVRAPLTVSSSRRTTLMRSTATPTALHPPNRLRVQEKTASPPDLCCTGVRCCSASTQRTICVQTAPSHPRPCRPGHLRERGS